VCVVYTVRVPAVCVCGASLLTSDGCFSLDDMRLAFFCVGGGGLGEDVFLGVIYRGRRFAADRSFGSWFLKGISSLGARTFERRWKFRRSCARLESRDVSDRKRPNGAGEDVRGATVGHGRVRALLRPLPPGALRHAPLLYASHQREALFSPSSLTVYIVWAACDG
jgi:hypothetical protein